VRRVMGNPELEVCAVNLPEPKKGEQILLLVAGTETSPEDIRKALVASGANPLGIPAEYRAVAEIPRLGSGKTDFARAKALAQQLL